MPCDNCKYLREELKDGWEVCCEAYPNGIPNDIYFKSNSWELKDCGHGYKYESISHDYPWLEKRGIIYLSSKENEEK